MKSRFSPWGALLLCAAGALLPLHPARAASSAFVVTNNSDTGDGTCSASGVGDGCNLREAITAANAATDDATITFDPTAFASAQTITLSGTELELSHNVLIKGPGAGLLSISGNGASRVFEVDASKSARFEDLSVVGGSSATAGGGGIYNSGTLTLLRCSVSNNQSGDSASGGGGIYINSGTVNIISSTIYGNTAGAGGFGGGIYNATGTLNVNSSTIAGNIAAAGGVGGGILNAAPMNLVNTTIAGNTADGAGGGLYNNGATSNLLHCTVTGNKSNAGGAGGAGGGIAATGTFNMSDTLLGGNSAPGDTGPDFNGTVATGDYDLLQNGTGATLAGTHNLVNVNPQIGALASNGGPVQTVALNAGSPAIDAGSSPLTNDARGHVRPVGAGVDIGAFEYNSSAVVQPGPTFTVTNTTDVDGACAVGNCSLRQAVSAANNSFDLPTITFDSTAFASAQTITLGGTELALSQGTTLIGPGSQLLTVSGNSASRVFDLTGTGAYNISGLTITKGLTTASSAHGAGLDADSTGGTKTVSLSDVTFNANTAGGVGGGLYLYNNSTTSTIIGCTFSGNVATAQGGGLYVSYGGLNISKSTFSGNSTTTGGSGNGGGGIFAYYTYNGMFIDSCTFAGNLAKSAGSGGGIYNSVGTVTVTNSTFSANKCPNGGFGGGIYNASTLTVNDSTFTLNAAAIGGSGNGGGGIANDSTLNLNNTIVGGNLASGGTGPDIRGTVSSGDYDLVKSTSGTTLSGTHNIAGQDPKLGALANNGGPTQTHLPLAGSPAIDAGSTTSTVDQRGLIRPVGAGNDIGAVESGSTVTAQSGPSFVVTNTTDADGACGVGNCSLRQAMRAANVYSNTVGTPTVTFDPTAFASAQTITLGGTEIDYTGSVNIVGTGTANLTINGNNLSRVFYFTGTTVVNVSDLTITGGSIPAQYGGAIRSDAPTTTLNRLVLTGNSAQYGGAIYGGFGGGSITLNACTVSNNSVSQGGGGLYGESDNTLTVNNSTITGNTAGSYNGGGGINDASGPLNINNSTINGNIAASYYGGGVFCSGTTAINNSTISGNAANNGYTGGGIYTGGGTLTMSNTIVANNTVSVATGADIEGTVQAGDYNLVRDTSDATLSGTHNVTGKDPKLGALANNGGPTQTQLLLSGSPAVNAGNPTFDGVNNPYEQRGVGYPRVVGSVVDIGATEFPNSPPTVVSVTPNSPVNRIGDTRAFSIKVKDTNGASDIHDIYFTANRTLSWEDGISVLYLPITNQFYLRDNDHYNGPITPGSGTLSCNAGTIAGSSVSVVADPDGQSLTLNFAATITGAMRGTNNLYVAVKDIAGTSDPSAPAGQFGNVTAGTWQVNGTSGAAQNPTIVLAPGTKGTTTNVNVGAETTFTMTLADGNGRDDLETGWMLINDPNHLGWDNGVTLVYQARTKRLFLRSSDGNSFLGGGVIGTASGLLQNSAASIRLAGCTVANTTSGVTVTLPVTFKTVFTGTRQVWSRVEDQGGLVASDADANFGFKTEGTLQIKPANANSAPTIALSPGAKGTNTTLILGNETTFTMTLGDGDGADDLNEGWMLINTKLDWTNGATLVYLPRNGHLYLRTTDGSSFLDGGVVGSATGVLQNSAVSVRMNGTSVTTSSNGIVLTLAVTPKAAFAGTKQVWSRVADGGGTVAADADAAYGFKTEGTLQLNFSGGTGNAYHPKPSAPSS